MISGLLAKLRSESHAGLLARVSTSSLMLQLFAAVLGIGTQAVLARILKVDAYGTYLYVITWARVLLLPGKAGFGTASLRFIPQYSTTGRLELLNGFLRRSHLVVLLTSTSVAVITALVVATLGAQLDRDLVVTIYVACLFIPFRSLLELQLAILRGFKRVISGLLAGTVFNRALLIILIVTALAAGIRANAQFAMALTVITVVSILAWTTRLIRGTVPDSCFSSRPDYRTGEWMRVAAPLFLLSGFQYIMGQTDVIMLGIFEGTTLAGIYGAASRISAALALGLTSANLIMAPLISELFTNKRMKELQRLVTQAAWGIFLFTIPVGLVVFLFAGPLLSIFGPSFIEGSGALRILVFGRAFGSLAGSVGFLMVMTGQHITASKVIGGSALLNILLNILLIPIYGITGAAIATVTTTVCWNTILIILVRRRLGINPLIRRLR